MQIIHIRSFRFEASIENAGSSFTSLHFPDSLAVLSCNFLTVVLMAFRALYLHTGRELFDLVRPGYISPFPRLYRFPVPLSFVQIHVVEVNGGGARRDHGQIPRCQPDETVIRGGSGSQIV